MDLDHQACYRAIASRDGRFDGRLFVGVRTTGVYCRPICPARTPRPENVAFFPTAAAAQTAGFRPCLRCRPETSPDFGAWHGSSNTVRRALRLIDDGALNVAGEAALGLRVGVGERQLRRLFRRHVGASPLAVAQTRRVLLAKQLIQDTDLSMAQVALAAGFGSIRRFNETFQRLYSRPPAALRRERPNGAPPAAEVVRLQLAYRAPYAWDTLLAFLAARAIPGVERVDAAGYARTIAIDGVRGNVKVSPAPGDQLAVSIRFAKLSALPSIVARVRRVFDLAADPAAVDAHLSGDPHLAPLVAARPGLRTPGAWDGFELAVRAVLGQQITVGAATALAGKLVAAFGAPLGEAEREEGLSHVFPAPPALCDATAIAALGMPRSRAAALTGLAGAASGDAALFAPRDDLAGTIDRLRSLPGFGEWTAQYIAMREFREPDAFPASDVALQRAMSEPGGARPTAAQLLASAEPWRPWRAYAAMHLWTSLSSSTPCTGAADHDRTAA